MSKPGNHLERTQEIQKVQKFKICILCPSVEKLNFHVPQIHVDLMMELARTWLWQHDSVGDSRHLKSSSFEEEHDDILDFDGSGAGGGNTTMKTCGFDHGFERVFLLGPRLVKLCKCLQNLLVFLFSTQGSVSYDDEASMLKSRYGHQHNIFEHFPFLDGEKCGNKSITTVSIESENS